MENRKFPLDKPSSEVKENNTTPPVKDSSGAEETKITTPAKASSWAKLTAPVKASSGLKAIKITPPVKISHGVKKKSPEVRRQSKEAQNFHTSMFKYWSGNMEDEEIETLLLNLYKKNIKTLALPGGSGHTLIMDLLHLPFGDKVREICDSEEVAIQKSILVMNKLASLYFDGLRKCKQNKDLFQERCKLARKLFTKPDAKNFNPLAQACKNGNEDLLKVYLGHLQTLVDLGAVSVSKLEKLFTAQIKSWNTTPFHFAGKHHNSKRIYELLVDFLEKNHPNSKDFLNKKILNVRDSSKRTPNVPKSILERINGKNGDNNNANSNSNINISPSPDTETQSSTTEDEFNGEVGFGLSNLVTSSESDFKVSAVDDTPIQDDIFQGSEDEENIEDEEFKDIDIDDDQPQSEEELESEQDKHDSNPENETPAHLPIQSSSSEKVDPDTPPDAAENVTSQESLEKDPLLNKAKPSKDENKKTPIKPSKMEESDSEEELVKKSKKKKKKKDKNTNEHATPPSIESYHVVPPPLAKPVITKRSTEKTSKSSTNADKKVKSATNANASVTAAKDESNYCKQVANTVFGMFSSCMGAKPKTEEAVRPAKKEKRL